MKSKNVLIIVIFMFSVGTISAQKMDNKKLRKVLEANSDSLIGDLGYWQFKHKQIWMLAVTDETHNRMRIVTPIVKVDEQEFENLEAALAANFHSVLDAKYAISEGLVWSVFIHPLKELSETQVTNAISQIYYSAMTYGTDYSGGDLVFPAKE